MRRLRTWGRDLVAFAEAASGQPVIWGETDCHALVRQACMAMYGADLFADVPAWRSKHEALARLARGEDIVTTLLAHGAHELPSVHHAVLGDLLIEPGPRLTVLRPTWVVVGSLHLGASEDYAVVTLRRPPPTYPEGTVAMRLPEL
jgi:hypothetical protein